MSDIVTGVRQAIQDLIAPELKSHAIKLEDLQKQVESVRDSLQKQIESAQKHGEFQHDVVMKTLDAFRAELRSEFALLRTNNQVEVPSGVACQRAPCDRGIPHQARLGCAALPREHPAKRHLAAITA